MEDNTKKYLNQLTVDIQNTADTNSDTDNVHYFVSSDHDWFADKDLFNALYRIKTLGSKYANVWIVRTNVKASYSINNFSGAPIVENDGALFIAEVTF